VQNIVIIFVRLAIYLLAKLLNSFTNAIYTYKRSEISGVDSISCSSERIVNLLILKPLLTFMS